METKGSKALCQHCGHRIQFFQVWYHVSSGATRCESMYAKPAEGSFNSWRYIGDE